MQVKRNVQVNVIRRFLETVKYTDIETFIFLVYRESSVGLEKLTMSV